MAEIPAPAEPGDAIESGDAAKVTAIDGLPVPAPAAEPPASAEPTVVDGLPEPAPPAEPPASSEVTAVDGLPQPAPAPERGPAAEPTSATETAESQANHQSQQAHEADAARRAEEAAAREAEEARQAQVAREAEEARQAAEARATEEARAAQAAREAEEARQAQAAREAEEARAAQAARQAEATRQAEAARQAARARQAEETRRAEAARARQVPSIERALSGPGRIDSWQRKVRVVPGGQGPGQPDRESLDRDRARLPLNAPHRIVFLGCTSGAGQTLTALMTGQVLAGLREEPVAAIDLNPGHASLSRQAQTAPVLTVADLVAEEAPASGRPGDPDDPGHNARLDIITGDADPASPALPDDRDYGRLARRVSRRYQLTLIDPGAAEVTRILAIADQLVLIAPASSDAPRSLGMTQEWLSGHGYGGLSQRAVTVVNGVSKASMHDVEQAETVARGRCRAIVRIPWDDNLAAGTADASSLRPQARHAYTALAGVLIAGLAAAPVPRKVLQ
jgi:MinD-like ATPase involved in chromosome partitioning or flagellar assembly